MEQEGNSLLKQLDHILSSDQQIDEVGFVHPSQLASLHADRHSSASLSSFWLGDHKLAISTEALVPLYKASKSALLPSRRVLFDCFQASESGNTADAHLLAKQILSCTRAAVIANPGFRTAWDLRKHVFVFLAGSGPFEELQLCRLVLFINPKCEEAWAHRRWTIRRRIDVVSCQISERVLEEEFELVAVIADRSRMNYRAWRHCCWLVQWMSPSQALHALLTWKKWAQLHAAESSCFQFRRCLFEKLLTDKEHLEKWKVAFLDELEWNKQLITFYIGREALWLHRRYLFFIWVHYFKPSEARKSIECSCPFLDDEIAFANLCIDSCNDNDTQDLQNQAVCAATFKLWVLLKCNETSASLNNPAMQINKLLDIERQLVCKASHQKALWEGLLRAFIAKK